MQKKHVNIPTKVIFGVASTFFTALVVTGATGVGLAMVVVLPTDVATDVVLAAPTTTGSDDGIGLPSFVCSFNTCRKTNNCTSLNTTYTVWFTNLHFSLSC